MPDRLNPARPQLCAAVRWTSDNTGKKSERLTVSFATGHSESGRKSKFWIWVGFFMSATFYSAAFLQLLEMAAEAWLDVVG